MEHLKLFSRRNVEPKAKTDFRPTDPGGTSPFAQLCRLKTYLETNTAPAQDITDCDDGISYLRELTYRKIFTGTSHAEYVELDASEPHVIDWLIAVHAVDAADRNLKNSQSRRTPR